MLAPILRSPSVSRIRYVSAMDTAEICLGYVSGDFYYFRILLCIGYAYGYVWTTLDTAQHNFWPIQPTNTYNPNYLTLPLSQYPTTPRAAAASRQGVPCSRIRQRHLRRRPTPRTPATPRDAADAPAACPAPARPLLSLCRPSHRRPHRWPPQPLPPGTRAVMAIARCRGLQAAAAAPPLQRRKEPPRHSLLQVAAGSGGPELPPPHGTGGASSRGPSGGA